MKNAGLFLKLSLIFLSLNSAACAQNEKIVPVKDASGHPRILLLQGEEAALKQLTVADNTWNTIHQYIIDESDKLIDKPPVERVLIGRRLLDKSREALRRIFYLSYSYRLTNQPMYRLRAEKEMLAVSEFTDWNPSHFLDVAEMTMGVAIGYDWLYDALSPESRARIRNAMIEKGLKPSLDSRYNSWLKASHNWNQVCNAGMTFGALAIYDEDKDLARQLITRAAGSITLPMSDYQPDGAYPEGYSYWGYGTSFNIMYLSAIQKAFGENSGVTINEGFLKTAGYLGNVTGPSGSPFNYSDCGSSGGVQPAMFWFANRLNDPSLLWMQKYYLLNRKPSNDRLLPALLIWSSGLQMDDITPPDKKIWVGQGKNPVALMRTSWTDPNAIFIGLKAGSPSVNHGHMDVGSFVMDANGERWAMDFGMQDYNSLETAGVSLWGMAQNSQRWQVFRYNNFVHNTLTVNDQLQLVDGKSIIDSHSEKPGFINAITDLTTVYRSYLAKSVRGVAIVDNQYVLVRDEIETAAEEVKIRWNLLTSATVSITGANTAELTKNGKKLTLKVSEPARVTMRTWTTTPVNSYDAPNPGTVMVGFEVVIPKGSSSTLAVLLLPENAKENNEISVLKLGNWPKNSGK